MLPVIVSIIGLRAGWIYKRDKVFNSRKAISEFSYNLYKNTNDENFKRIAEEYGISALTKDSNLTPEQRRILLRSKDPVRDIDNYSKCQKLLYISDNLTIFQWTKKRYRFWIWRRTVEIVSLIIYFTCSFLVAIPFLYSTMFSSGIVEKINGLSTMTKFGLASYCIGAIAIAIAKIIFIIMVLLILVAAIGRAMGYPLIWSIEISMVLFAWVSMFSIHYAQVKQRNMGIDILSKRLPVKVQDIVDYINRILIISFLGFGTYSGYVFMWDTRSHILPISEISHVVLSAAVPTGCLLMIFTCVEQLIDKINSNRASSIIGNLP